MQQQPSQAQPPQAPAPPSGSDGFELEEALYATAPVGLHCVDARGVILWANQTELSFLGYARSEYVGRRAANFVYSDQANALAGSTGGQNQSASDGSTSGGAVNVMTADDKTLYTEVLKRVMGGNPISEIPVRFVSRSGAIVHLILDCDGTASFLHGTSSAAAPYENRYFRFFTRDDTARRIQEMRSNVLFQETNRSLQMLDNFMNRSMQQMRAPLTLMEKACNLVTENIEDIDEVIRRNAAASVMMANFSSLQLGGGSSVDPSVAAALGLRRSSLSNQNLQNLVDVVAGEEDGKPHALPLTPVANAGASLSVALSATLEARSVVGLASTLTKDALALVDDITDLCRFDQGRALMIEKEAVKVRDICVEALMKVQMPVGSGLVDVVLDIQEGAPGRTMADRAVLQRSLALLLNFAVDAAANSVSTESEERGKVVLSVSVAPEGGKCLISVYYTNPPEGEGVSAAGPPALGFASNAPMDSSGAFSSAYTAGGDQPMSTNVDTNSGYIPGMTRGNSFGKLPSIFGECYSKPDNEDKEAFLLQQQTEYQAAQGGSSMMRRMRLRENIQDGMTSCRHDKLGLGLSLLYHLVGAQGSDLRYEIVSESSATAAPASRLPSMTKFWFLLPVSLDFPDRLQAEQIEKGNLQSGAQGRRQSLPATRSPLLPSAFAMPPDDIGLSGMQQPPQKRARTTPGDPMDGIVSANIMGTESSASFAPVPAPSPAAAALVEPGNGSNAANDNNASDAASKPAPQAKRYPGVAPGARPLVLVAEDTDVSASLICMHLRKLNCTSHRAENGEVAIEMLRSAPHKMYALVLMDLRMPVMDGFEATKVIKSSNAKDVPVVALTGETSEENRRRCDEIGFDDYKTKPLKRPQLKELLINLVPGYVPVD
ncbi:hypothetical protein ACHAXT_003337 [Thalassiosira profunda]